MSQRDITGGGGSGSNIVRDDFVRREVTSTPQGLVTLVAAVDPDPGEQIAFFGEIIANEGGGAFEGDVTFQPLNVSRVKSAMRSVFPGDTASSIRSTIEKIELATGTSLPDNPIDQFDLPATIRIPTETVGAGDDDSDAFRREEPLPQIVIPEVGDVNPLNQIPPLRVRVTFEEGPGGFRLPVIGRVSARPGTDEDFPDFVLEIPPELFVQVREVGDCGEVFTDVQQEFSSVKQDVTSALETVNSRAGRVEDIGNELRQLTGGQIPSFNLTRDVQPLSGTRPTSGVTGGISSLITDGGTTAIQQLTPNLLEDIDQSELEDILGRVESVRSSFPSPGLDSLQSNIDSLRSSIQGMPDGECKQQYTERLSGLEDTFSEAESIFNDYTEVQERLRDLIGEREVEPVTQIPCEDEFSDVASQVEGLSSVSNARDLLSQLEEGQIQQRRPRCFEQFRADIQGFIGDQDLRPCDDVPQRINNQVSGLETEVNTVSPSNRPERIRSLIQEKNDLQERVDNLDVPERCVSRLDSRLSRAGSRLQDIREEQERIDAIEGVDCSSQFSDISRRIESFRSDVSTLTSPSAQQIDSIVSEGQSILEDISTRVDSAECAEEFTNRVRAGLNEVQERNVSVRIKTGELTGAEASRQQRIEELQTQLNSFIGNLEPGSSVPDFQDS